MSAVAEYEHSAIAECFETGGTVYGREDSQTVNSCAEELTQKEDSLWMGMWNLLEY